VLLGDFHEAWSAEDGPTLQIGSSWPLLARCISVYQRCTRCNALGKSIAGGNYIQRLEFATLSEVLST